MATITEQKQSAATSNPFGRVSFAWPKYDSVYPDARGGGKSTKMLMFTVPLSGCGLSVDGSIYMRLKVTDTGHEIQASASTPKALSGDKASTDAFLAHIENSAMKWAEYDAAWGAAESRLTGVKVESTAKVVRPNMAPRLVKAVPTALPTSAPAVN